MHFQTSTGNSSGQLLYLFHPSQRLLHFSTDTIYLFVNHFCFLCPRVSVIFLVHQFLKVLLPSLQHCLRIYHYITVFILYNPHVLYIFPCSVSLPSQSVQLFSLSFVSNLAYKSSYARPFAIATVFFALLFFSL